ncbi:MAG TPA: Hsp70 family protein, partial [Thiolinea sp.]|nr:Hsp70 family protein [Thiolinea sp.]
MKIIGIDLGTTNSAAAIWQNGQVELIPNRLNEYLTPSVVHISQDGNVLVGKAAQERLLTHPNSTASVFKRYMGTDRKLTLAKKPYSAPELSAFVLKSLKEDAENYLGEPVAEAVISVPAYFNNTQRKATILAGE